jgi:hypothetical protein
MKEETPTFPDVLFKLLFEAWPDIALLLERSWETPAALCDGIHSRLVSAFSWTPAMLQCCEFEVIGSPPQRLLSLRVDEHIALYSVQRGKDFLAHPFVRELVENWKISFDPYALQPSGTCLITSLSVPLKARLNLPSVVLVSLFHPEMYPTSRLTLGTAYLASYLRLHHLARVKILDCQFGLDVQDILAYVEQSTPDVLGISVNFGQFDLMQQLLDSLYGGRVTGKLPLIVLGNILPAMCFREILKVYPEVVICRKEGELSLAALVKCGRDRSRWYQVPGIYYCNVQGKLMSTPCISLPMEHLPPPALDTVYELFEHDGVITAEFSRGCQYNRCSFCPRTHKGVYWKTLPLASMLQQWEIFAQVFQHFQREPHVFLADEDFIGQENGAETVQRLVTFLDRVQEQNLQITFDASCRADQIFREDCDWEWHVRRGNLFRCCLAGGLSRLFLGVESGAPAQLRRYNKGSTVEEIISAIRYLSLLGVRLRFGFIFFDPLMSVQDVVDNIEFLGRTDVILPVATDASIEEIFTHVWLNHQHVMPLAGGRAIYEDISYMVSPLEVLAKSQYLFDLRQQVAQLVSEPIDVSFARYQIKYVLSDIESICTACQYWVNYCFPIVYALKGLQKTARGKEREILSHAITHHRYLGYLLIRTLAQAFSLVDDATSQRWEQMHPGLPGNTNLYLVARRLLQVGDNIQAMNQILVWFEEQMRCLIEQVNCQISFLSVTKQHIWYAAYRAWATHSLGQMQALRTA